VRAALLLILIASCYRTHGYRGGKDLYEPVGIRPDNAARKAPPPDVGTTALALGADAPPIRAMLPAHERIVVVFYRGDWCPYCRAQLRDLQAHAADFDARHAALVAISVDSAETSEHLATGLALTFPLVSDPGHHVIERFGVFDTDTEIAWPSIFVIDHTGKIAWRWVADDFQKRITTTDVLAAIDALH
jgi:peroxiredoxin